MWEKAYNCNTDLNWIPMFVVVVFFTHLLLCDPAHGIIKDPAPLEGPHAASVPSFGHTAD